MNKINFYIQCCCKACTRCSATDFSNADWSLTASNTLSWEIQDQAQRDDNDDNDDVIGGRNSTFSTRCDLRIPKHVDKIRTRQEI